MAASRPLTPPRIHRAARAEILATLAQYDAIDPALAVDLRKRIEAAYLRIGMRPLQFPPHLRGTRQCLLRRFPFSIVFTVEPELVVLAFAHQRRRPGYWSRRKP